MKKASRKKLRQKGLPNSVGKRNLDSMKLLVSWDKFQQDIKNIRERFGIPSEGFKNDKESEKWQKDLYKKSDRFFESDYYKEKKQKILPLK